MSNAGEQAVPNRALEAIRQGFEKYAQVLSGTSALDALLDSIYRANCPTEKDYNDRRDLIRKMNEVAKEIYANLPECPVLEAFGSFVTGIFHPTSDLDLSVNFTNKIYEDPSEKKKCLNKFGKKFYSMQHRGTAKNVLRILNAKVAVVKVTDCQTGIECDLSVGNMEGIAISHFLRIISSIDERFKKLCIVVKAWAGAYGINCPREETFNSLSLFLLVALHFQNRSPPILPPFSALLQDGSDPVSVEKIIPRFLNYGKENTESIAALFVSLLVMLESVELLWQRGLCASTYDGSWIPKQQGTICVENFIDRSQNTARAVTTKKMTKIYTCIHYSLQQIQSFSKGIVSVKWLKDLLFCPDQSPGSDLHKLLLQNSGQKISKKLNKFLARRQVQPQKTDDSGVDKAVSQQDSSQSKNKKKKRKRQEEATSLEMPKQPEKPDESLGGNSVMQPSSKRKKKQKKRQQKQSISTKKPKQAPADSFVGGATLSIPSPPIHGFGGHVSQRTHVDPWPSSASHFPPVVPRPQVCLPPPIQHVPPTRLDRDSSSLLSSSRSSYSQEYIGHSGAPAYIRPFQNLYQYPGSRTVAQPTLPYPRPLNLPHMELNQNHNQNRGSYSRTQLPPMPFHRPVNVPQSVPSGYLNPRGHNDAILHPRPVNLVHTGQYQKPEGYNGARPPFSHPRPENIMQIEPNQFQNQNHRAVSGAQSLVTYSGRYPTGQNNAQPLLYPTLAQPKPISNSPRPQPPLTHTRPYHGDQSYAQPQVPYPWPVNRH